MTVPDGQGVGATFQHLPLCGAGHKTGCVIAYSSFPTDPPLDSGFGRPGRGISVNSGQTRTTGVHVACVNPAAIDGGTAVLSPYFTVATVVPLSTMAPLPPAVATPWVTYPDEYSATCESTGGATWLEVAKASSSKDPRPKLTEPFGASWGYHLDDINLALGNLVDDVRNAEQSYDGSS